MTKWPKEMNSLQRNFLSSPSRSASSLLIPAPLGKSEQKLERLYVLFSPLQKSTSFSTTQQFIVRSVTIPNDWSGEKPVSRSKNFPRRE